MKIIDRLFTQNIDKLLNSSVKVSRNAYNKAGNKITSRGTIARTKDLRLLNAPQGATYADILNIEKAFGKEKVQVLSFFDINGKILSRIRKDGDKVVKSTYQHNKNNQGIFEVIKDFIINGEAQKTLYTKLKLVKIPKKPKKKKYKKYHIKKKPITIKDTTCYQITLKTKALQNGERGEQQLFRSWEINDLSTEKRLETRGVRYKDGGVSLRKISGNIENIEELKKDPYIMIRNYNNKDFTQSLLKIISDRFKIKPPKLFFEYSKKAEQEASYNYSYDAVIITNIDFKTHYKLVEDIAHELRHAVQYNNYSYFKNLLKELLGIKTSKNETKLAYNFMVAKAKYPYIYGDFDKYWNNGLEVDARKYAERIQKEYVRKTKKLESAIYIQDILQNDLSCNDTSLSNFINNAKKVTIKGLFDN